MPKIRYCRRVAPMFAQWDIFSHTEAESAFRLMDAERRTLFVGYGACLLTVVGWKARRVSWVRNEAQPANLAKSQFLARMSHEIHTAERRHRPGVAVTAWNSCISGGRKGLRVNFCFP